MIGNRIKQARIAAGLSLRELAAKVDYYVTAQAINKYEKKRSIPGNDVLHRLSQALQVKVEYFSKPSLVQVYLSEPIYRKRPTVKSSIIQTIQAQTKIHLEKYFEMEELFPNNYLKIFTAPDKKKRTIKKLADVEILTRQLREEWNLGIDPLRSVSNMLEDIGVKVMMVDSNKDIDGFSCWANETIPVVVVNKNFPTDRLRFTLLHELGHLLINCSSSRDKEAFANRFAGSFLVPEESAKYDLGENRKYINWWEFILLREKYGMSVQAWIHRACELDIISERYAATLFQFLRKSNLYDKEIGKPLRPESCVRFEMLVYRAVEEKLISLNKAAELLNVSLVELREFPRNAI